MTSTGSPGAALARLAGNALGLIFGAAATMRRTKPLHPRGVVVGVRLERTGTSVSWGVPWLDDPGVDAGVVRMSRAMGLPDAWPDVLGLAVTFSDVQGRHDLLLATTGMAPMARHVLLPRINPLSASYSSLFTYKTPRGHAVIAAVPGARPDTFTLLAAPVMGDWQEFGTVRLCDDLATGADRAIDFDPIRNPLPGLTIPPALAALREPAYAAARRMRSNSRAGRGADEPAFARSLA